MDKNLVEKSNILNNFKCKPKEQMTLNELRFFCLFVSRLNPLDREKRTVDIKISDFERLFNVKINTTEFNQTISHILSRAMYVYETGEKHTVVNLYSKFEWIDGFKNNIISISANYDIVPFLWDLKGNYTSYRLINIAKLNSVSKIRLYEILTQYKNKKEFIIEVQDLKELLQSKQKEFKDFNKFVLKPAIRDINECTDITVKYEKILKCRKCVALKFYIKSKTIDEHEIKQIEISEPVKAAEPEKKEIKNSYSQYFSKEQEEMFKAKIHTVLQGIYKSDDMLETRTNAIYSKCLINFEMKHQVGTLKNPLAYMSGIITNAVSAEIDKPMKEKNRSYNLNDFEKLAINHKEIEEMEQLNCEPETVKSEERICTQSEAAVRRSEMERVITPVKEETALDGMENSSTDDITKMQAEADLCVKVAELIKNAADYESAIRLLDMVIVNWRNFDGFFADQIKDEMTKRFGADH